MKFINQLFIILILLSTHHAFAEPEAGRDYTVLNPAQPTHSGKKIEVLEFFSYTCDACFRLQPQINSWKKNLPEDVSLTVVASMLRDEWEVAARTFYTLEALGQQQELSDDLFIVWGQHNMDEASVTDFVAKHGVDIKNFGATYNSFVVHAKVSQSKQMVKAYLVNAARSKGVAEIGVPALVVDGKYFIYNLPPAETMQVLNALLDKVRRERSNLTPSNIVGLWDAYYNSSKNTNPQKIWIDDSSMLRIQRVDRSSGNVLDEMTNVRMVENRLLFHNADAGGEQYDFDLSLVDPSTIQGTVKSNLRGVAQYEYRRVK